MNKKLGLHLLFSLLLLAARPIQAPRITFWTVTAYTDSGPGTLRDLIQQANASPEEDVILFNDHVQIEILSPLPPIIGKITIDKTDSQYSTFLEWFQEGMLFTVPAGSILTLHGIGMETIRQDVTANNAGIWNAGELNLNGCGFYFLRSDLGGAIYNQGSLTIQGGIFVGNQAEQGGAIYNTGMMTLQGELFGRNSAEIGGAIYNLGNLDIKAVNFNGNDASREAGAIYNAGVLSAEDTLFRNNSVSAGSGGGISSYGQAYLTRATFNNNTVQYIADTHGGGIQNFAQLTLVDSLMIGNWAQSGGGIWNAANGVLYLENTRVEGNLAPTGSGGGINNEGVLTMNGGGIPGNFTGGSGAGLYNSGSAHLHGVSVSNVNFAVQQGGGIYNSGGLWLDGGSLVQGNTAHQGGGIANFGELHLEYTRLLGNSSDGMGGGIHNSGQSWIAFTTLDGNSSARLGGGIYNSSAADVAALDLQNSTLSNNHALQGGGLGNDVLGRATVRNSTISGNWTVNYMTPSNGGGIYNAGDLDLAYSTLAYNRAVDYGGGLFSVEGVPLLVNASIIASNSARTSSRGNCAGGTAAGSYNLSDSDTCPGFEVGDPRLASLADNGGLTLTHTLLSGSWAVDRIPPEDCTVENDQRLAARPLGPTCDIGAVEVEWTTRLVQIDILPKPGPNRIDISRPGLVPVAVLSTPGFNAPGLVQRQRLTFGRRGLEDSLWWKLPGVAACTALDVNNDELPDLLCNFRIELTNLQCGDSLGYLQGYTSDGTRIASQDSVMPVPCR